MITATCSDHKPSNMSKQDLYRMIQSDAHNMGDDFGEDPQTLEILAEEYNLKEKEIRKILRNNNQQKAA